MKLFTRSILSIVAVYMFVSNTVVADSPVTQNVVKPGSFDAVAMKVAVERASVVPYGNRNDVVTAKAADKMVFENVFRDEAVAVFNQPVKVGVVDHVEFVNADVNYVGMEKSVVPPVNVVKAVPDVVRKVFGDANVVEADRVVGDIKVAVVVN